MPNIFTDIRHSICNEIETLTFTRVIPSALDYAEHARRANGKYGVLSDRLKAANEHISMASPISSSLYNRYLIAYYGELCLETNHELMLPQSIYQLLQNDLRRIREQLDIFPDSFYQLTNEPYLKDLAIVRKKLIPVGAEYAEAGKRLWKGVIFRDGIRQFVSMLNLLITKNARSSNFLSLHLHSLNVIRLDVDECMRMYSRIAELMILNPDISGVVNSGWFMDPAMSKVSPHLSHLNNYPKRHGAYIFFVHQEDDQSDALTSSRTRRQLYKSGRYQPAAHMSVWLRADILKQHSD